MPATFHQPAAQSLKGAPQRETAHKRQHREDATNQQVVSDRYLQSKDGKQDCLRDHCDYKSSDNVCERFQKRERA